MTQQLAWHEKVQKLFIVKELELDFERTKLKQDITPGTRVLMLGSGECGKSTLYSQFAQLFGRTYTNEDLNNFTSTIYFNVFRLIGHIDTLLQQKNITLQNVTLQQFITDITTLLLTNNSLIITAKDVYDEAIHDNIQKLLIDPQCGPIIESIVFGLYFDTVVHSPDGLSQFVKKSNYSWKFTPRTYMPSNEDIIHCYRKTTGLNSYRLRHKESLYEFIDPGGQRSERKKWNSVISNNDIVIFVVSLADFARLCYEDDITNRLVEALDVFESYVDTAKDRPTILVLNKCDILYRYVEQERIHTKFLSQLYPQSQINWDNASSDDIIDFIRNEFIETFKKKRTDIENLKCFECCATNIESVKVIWNYVISLSEQLHTAHK
jgi:GTPase SAR1 family protein